MIELAFSESTAGALKFAKSMKKGACLQGATAVIGGTAKEKREAKKPRIWKGETMEGGSQDVAALSLYLDIGDISDADGDLENRKKLLKELFSDCPGVVADGIWDQSRAALSRLEETKKTLEPVRIWICADNPTEMCGLYFVCRFMAGAATPLFLVCIPERVETEDRIVTYRGTGDIEPEELSKYAACGTEGPVSQLRRGFFADIWSTLSRENAPLRAVVNGTIMSVPENFYDFALRAHMPDGDFRVAQLIGKTLADLPGAGDRWFFLRICAMIRSGELVVVREATDDHPYSAVIKRSRPASV
jgi:hypothetical protein